MVVGLLVRRVLASIGEGLARGLLGFSGEHGGKGSYLGGVVCGIACF